MTMAYQVEKARAIPEAILQPERWFAQSLILLLILAATIFGGLSLFQYYSFNPSDSIAETGTSSLSRNLLWVNLSTTGIYLILSIVCVLLPGKQKLVNPIFTLAGTLLILNTLARIEIQDVPLAGIGLYFILATVVFTNHIWFFINAAISFLAFVAACFLLSPHDLPDFKIMHFATLVIGSIIYAGKWKLTEQINHLYRFTRESAASASEELHRLQSLLDHATDMIYSVNHSGEITYLNANARHELNPDNRYDPGAIEEGEDALPSPLEGHWALIEQQIKDLKVAGLERQSIEYGLASGSGKDRRFNHHLWRMDRDQKGPSYHGIIREISDFHHASTQVQEREQVIKAVSKLAGPLLTQTDQTEALNDALLEVADSLQLEALAIYKNYTDRENVLRLKGVAYWDKNNTRYEVNDIPFSNYSFAELGLPEMGNEAVEIAQIHNSTPVVKEAILDAKLQFLGTIPLIVKGKWWGILGFTDSSSGQDWHKDKTNSIRSVSSIIGNAIERFEAEDALMASEESIRSLVEIAPIGIIVMDRHSILLANKTVREMIPFDPYELISINDLVNVVSREDITRAQATLDEVFNEGKRTTPITIKIRGKENQSIYIEASGAPIVYKGRPAALAVLRDITSQQLYEAGLWEARKKAEEASEAKTQFLANMSHEIRTPLNGILGMAQILKLKKLPTEQYDQVQTIVESSQSLLTILDDILDFSKIEAGKVTAEKLPFDMDPLLQEVEKLFMPVAEEKNLNFILDIRSGFPDRLLGDAPKLRQVLINLLSNAVKFTVEGSVTLGVESVNKSHGQTDLRFEVIDTGIGIEESRLESIFESFNQADNSITREFGGTGLGLAITDRLVDLMGGRITVQSQAGYGTSFEVLIAFDLCDEKMGKEKINKNRKKEAQNGKVLLVEDNRINQLVALKFLEHLGFEVDSAVNGQEAVEMAKASEYDVVLMDIQMPIMDGITACQEIRKIPGAKDTPVIAMTANAMEGDRDTYIEAGLDDYIAKPVHLTDLEKILKANLPRTYGSTD